MKVAIHIVSHLKDLIWLEWCLKSINKMAKGFSEVVVVVPVVQTSSFQTVCHANNARLISQFEQPPPFGQLNHQIHKCRADEHCPSADFVAHVDSDCVFRDPVTPDDYFVDGKPVLLVQEWAKAGPAACWKAGVDKALGIKSTHETMRRHPAVHYLSVYQDVRLEVVRVNNKPFNAYVLTQKFDYPQGFSEFNTIGNYVLGHCRDKYHIIDVSSNPYPRSKLVQFWSHAPPDKSQGVWLDGKEISMVPIEYIKGQLQL